jgi:phosphatidylinositol 4-kinase
MKEVESEIECDELSKSLIDESMDEDEDLDIQEGERDDFKDKSCISKCCFYLWCCCCCHSSEKSKKSYQKGWRSYLIKEGVDSSDEPFLILTNLFTNKDGSISALESIRLNPNLVSANKLRNDLEFYIPQLCTFLLFGEMKAIEEFFVFLCKVCNASFFFAHRVHWFLSAMINAAQEKRDDIIDILKMINTLFKSENQKRKTKLNKFYIANSSPFIKFIKNHNLYFLYDNKTIQNQTNIFDEVDYNNLDGYQQEMYNKYKKSRDIIIEFSEDEYKKMTGKNKNEIIDESKDKLIDNEKFKSNDFFIDISNFKLLNNEVTFDDEDIDEEEPKQIYEEKINIDQDNFVNTNKSPLDINFVSYHSTLNFIDHLCDISNELPKHPIEEQMNYLYEQLLEINKKLPCNVYLPFLEESTRNYLICHIPLDGVRIFRTKTRCPIMLTFELIRIDEINKGIKKEEEDGEMINIGRSKSIASLNSSMGLENTRKKKLLKDKIVSGPKKNNFKKADYDLSKPVLLQNLGNNVPSRLSTSNMPMKDKKPKTKTEMTFITTEEKKEEDKNEEDIDTRLEKYSHKHRKSVASISSSSSLNEEDINEKFKKIVTKFRINPVKTQRGANTINTNSNLDIGNNIDNEINIKSNETKPQNKKESLLDEDTDKYNDLIEAEMQKPENVNTKKNLDIPSIKKVFEKTFKQKAREIKKNSLFGNLDSHKIFRCIFKTHEDLRQEQFATQLINEFYQIFKLENTGCWLNTYEIISTGNDAGLVEMVNDSVSLDQLKQKIHQASLHDFYLYNFGNGDENSPSYKRAMDNYVASLAGYSLVCYFLQIKDRHNGNILLDNEGHLVHIDFGFLLSNAPGKGLKFENAPFKLSRDMVDCLGGIDGKYFSEFRKLLHKGFKAVNKHRLKISILVEMMYCGHGKNLDCFEKGQEAIDNLKMRLNPQENMNNVDIKKFVDNLISQSVDNWRTKWYDIFQYYVQGIFY